MAKYEKQTESGGMKNVVAPRSGERDERTEDAVALLAVLSSIGFFVWILVIVAIFTSWFANWYLTVRRNLFFPMKGTWEVDSFP